MMRLGWLGPHYAIALCLLLSVGSKMGTAQDRSKAERVIAIAENAKSTNRWIRQKFETVHVGRRSLDDTASVRAFQLFLDELDPDRAVFLNVDFEAFRKYEKRLDDLFRDDSFEFANLAYGVFLNRLPESFAMAHQQIDAHHNFDIQEDYDTQPQSIAYAHDRADLMERYRKLIKYQFLELRLAGKSDQEIRNELHLRYQSREKREINGQLEDMLVRYFTALGHALDPHTRYMSPEETDAMFGRLTQRQTGIGAALRSENGIIQIQSLVPGGAASLDGRLRPGDSILAVKQSACSDAVELHGMSVEEVAKLIRGDVGTRIALQIRHADKDKAESIEITRAPIRSPENETQSRIIPHCKKADGDPFQIGWIQVPSFYADSTNPEWSVTNHVRQSLASFRIANVDAVVIDLSKNASGSLSEVIATAGLFIDQGVILQAQASGGEIEFKRDPTSGVEWAGPLVVKVSQISTSASEVFAGAMQDYQRGLIVGDAKTHGKGTIQTVLPDTTEPLLAPPSDGSGFRPGSLKLTIQKFYLPSGRSTQRVGVASDVTLPSMTSKLQVSEGDLPYSLQQDHVPSVAFDRCGLINTAQIETLQRNSHRRTSGSQAFQQRIQQAQQLEHQIRTSKIPLRESEFRGNQLFDTDQMESEARQFSDLNRDMDFYDQEILHIVRDYVELQRVSRP